MVAVRLALTLLLASVAVSCSSEQADPAPSAAPVATTLPSTSPVTAPATSAAGPSSSATVAAQTTTVSTNHGGRDRSARLYIPERTAAVALPLVVQLHGGAGSGERIDEITGFEDLASREGFAVVSPSGIEGNWNDGRADTGSVAEREQIDDVGYLAALIDRLVADGVADRRRVYVVGISNGAMMAHRLACESPDGTLAGIGMVVGTAPDPLPACPAAPLPVIAFYGTDDPLLPYGGGMVTTTRGDERGRVVAVDTLASFLAERLGQNAPVETVVADDVSLRDWSAGEVTVRFYRIDGGGHTWPGGPQYLPERRIGATTQSIDATATMWQFFAES
jgi:polyhydroxybutyrate depolymerase